MSFADAINAAVREEIDRLQDFGGLLAQAGLPLPTDLSEEDLDHVQYGYDRQLRDYPNG